ncbi:MAG: S9 family peptidase [Thermoanaerobaculia bacterium]|nr:S9 family peptidase [Thermoanaerobaculia bacterium]
MTLKLAAAVFLIAVSTHAQVPANLVVEQVPAFPPELVEKVRPYLDSRSATFLDWNPVKPEMLIRTRFAETSQLHVVKMPGGDRRQITFFGEAVGSAAYKPGDPNTIVFARDIGGNENYQFYRLDVPSGDVTLLTDGKSRNVGRRWSRDGKWIAYSSNKRSGNDMDVWVLDPAVPQSARMVMQAEGGGWGVTDFSRDGSKLLATREVSANETEIYLLDIATGAKTLLTPTSSKVAYSAASFSADDSEIFFTSDAVGEFQQLHRMKLAGRTITALTREPWDVEQFALSDDRSKIAYVTNENGANALKVMNAADGKHITQPRIPIGVIGNVEWHPNGKLIGFSISHARSTSDVYSFEIETNKLERWTDSETGGLNPERNAEPQLVMMKSFDGLQISAFAYRPDAKKFPGKRPVVINIHGGPEGQAQPGFRGRTNYWINELGVAVVFPNVRGSSGYGKTFLASDNGFKREDSVRDIGAILDWIAKQPDLDADRVAVTGGSYGGYMVLASLIHHGDRLRAGIDTVGISSFLTFLDNTSGYRRDLRRVEYGDEREPKMKEFLQQISPLTSVAKIKDPLFVIMGFNDPRVPYTEGEQLVKAVRANGASAWYLMAKDEGHGFAKRSNQDFEFLAMTMFLREHLLR